MSKFEKWVFVTDSGKIMEHFENDGHRFMLP